MQIDINAVLETLKVGKSAKTQASLDKLNETLKTYFELGRRDFSITTISDFSSSRLSLAAALIPPATPPIIIIFIFHHLHFSYFFPLIRFPPIPQDCLH